MKARSKVLDWLVYAIIRYHIFILQSLPLSVCYRMADGLAWLAFKLNKRHRNVALENLRYAYPSLMEAERNQMVKETYRHFFRMIMEMMHLPLMLKVQSWERHVKVEGGEKLITAMLSGRPVLIITGHFGNWELAGYALAMFGFKSTAVARTIDNPYLDALIRRFRKHTGQELLNKNGDAGRMAAVLRSGGILCTLADQDAGKNGLYVNYFGRPASTHKGIGVLALHNEAIVAVVGAYRTGKGLDYTVRVEDVFDSRDYLDQPRSNEALTQRYTNSLQSLVERSPEQYLWLHRRWKHQPMVKTNRKAA